MMLTRRNVAAWLLRNGFYEQPNAGTGHRYFTHPPSGVKIALPGHGPTDLTKKIASNILRSLEKAGFDRDCVRRELM